MNWALLRATLRLPVYDALLHVAAALGAFCRFLQEWWLVAFPAEIELVTGRWCQMCDDVHEMAVECPREIIRLCVDCDQWVSVDRYFHCPVATFHVVHPDARRDEFWRPLSPSPASRRGPRRGLRAIP